MDIPHMLIGKWKIDSVQLRMLINNQLVYFRQFISRHPIIMILEVTINSIGFG